MREIRMLRSMSGEGKRNACAVPRLSSTLRRQIGHNPKTIGHPGAGGSIAWADPDKRLAVAICHNRMFLPPNAAQDPIRQAVTAAFGAD